MGPTARLSGVIRRRLGSAVGVALLALAASGCATFEDSGVAARVGDESLTQDRLAAMMREAMGDDEAQTAPSNLSTEILNSFLLDQIIRTDLAAAGVTPPAPAVDDTLASLNVAAGDAFAAWQATPPNPVSDAVVRAEYERGPVESDMACTRHILVASPGEARDVLARLDDGEPFADVAAQDSTDTGSAANGGSLGCMNTGQFAQTFVPEFVQAALDAEVGTPVGPVESQFGFHVIELTPFDDLAPDALAPLLASPSVRLEFVSRGLDVWVDPRFGAFEGAFGVVPLGQPARG